MVQRTNYAPLVIAIPLLLLPLLYVGTYFALVVPSGYYNTRGSGAAEVPYSEHYRCQSGFCERIFAPLEQIDRRLRPDSWGPTPENFFAGLKRARERALRKKAASESGKDAGPPVETTH